MNAQFQDGWRLANESLVSAIAPLTPAQLATEIYPNARIWQSVSHLAGTRVYWLCEVAKEPGHEKTSFRDVELAKGGWEDDPTHPRSADELTGALASTFRVIEDTLTRWTDDTLATEVRRVRGDGVASIHTRGSILWRMITHDCFHIGEISLALGTNGIGTNDGNGPIDLWSGLSRPAT